MCVYIYIYTRIADGHLYIFISLRLIQYPSEDWSLTKIWVGQTVSRYFPIFCNLCFFFLQSLNTEKNTHMGSVMDPWLNLLAFQNGTEAIPDRPNSLEENPMLGSMMLGIQYVNMLTVMDWCSAPWRCFFAIASKCIKSKSPGLQLSRGLWVRTLGKKQNPTPSSQVRWIKSPLGYRQIESLPIADLASWKNFGFFFQLRSKPGFATILTAAHDKTWAAYRFQSMPSRTHAESLSWTQAICTGRSGLSSQLLIAVCWLMIEGGYSLAN